MNNKNGLLIVVILIIMIAAICMLTLGKSQKVEYYLTTSKTSSENTFFEDYASFKKFVSKNNGLKDTIENKADFKKYSIEEKFTEDFFKEKKLALISVYEDTSKDYMYSVDKIEYNADKTEVTIYYTYKYGTFADVLSSTWYDYMFVELESSVEKVNFHIDNSSKSK